MSEQPDSSACLSLYAEADQLSSSTLTYTEGRSNFKGSCRSGWAVMVDGPVLS